MKLNEAFSLDYELQNQIGKLIKETNYFVDEYDALTKIFDAGLQSYLNRDSDKFITFLSQEDINNRRNRRVQSYREELQIKLAEIRGDTRPKLPNKIKRNPKF
ncbi:hypothetical protein VBD025_00830 [Virgibacillus flavescens]|uniref:hypothetical protein n=1 Tax=Virgibacillus flavescens TaxID=1611422 RepID=UPI003D34416F